MLEDLKHYKRAVGVKQSTKAIEGGIATKVFIARDCEQRVVKGIIVLCEKQSVPIIYVDSMKQLGKACGIEVEAAVACILS